MSLLEYEFKHVLWAGGPSGSGKTTIGRRLAVRHGLRYVGTDKLMQEHHRRGVERGLPGMTRWEHLTPDERWLGDPTEMASLLFAVGDESWSLLLEDLNTIPRHPGVVVEGRPLRPSLVAPVSRERRNAVWILPTEEAQLRNLDARGASARSLASDPDRARQNRLQRELLVARQLRAETEQLECLTVRVGSGDDLESVYRAVESELDWALQAVPRAHNVGERSALRCAENEDLAEHLRLFLVERPDAGTPQTFSTRFACECGAEGDCEEVELTLKQYAETVTAGRRVIALGHSPARKNA